jgi:hypothetical protein
MRQSPIGIARMVHAGISIARLLMKIPGRKDAARQVQRS